MLVKSMPPLLLIPKKITFIIFKIPCVLLLMIIWSDSLKYLKILKFLNLDDNI